MNSAPSIKKNFAYKSALTLSSYIMAFITFPYVSRILGVERIGLVNFVDNTVSYFLLFATMGVNLLGVREIASVKDNPTERSRVFANIFGLNILFTVVTLLIYFLLVAITPKLNQYAELFYIGAAKILCTAFIVEWLFTGIENFKYITLRSIAIKILYVVSIFIFVRSQEDYKLYFVLTVSTIILNAVVNFSYARKFVRPTLKDYFNFKYLKRNCILGIYSIMTQMYLTFNVMFLGLTSGNTQVSYYTTAFKVYMVVLGFFTAFTNVMLPRMSALLAQVQNGRFQQLVDKSFSTMCAFSIPMIACSMILSPQIIYVLSGPRYEGAITPMRIIMPAALFVGIAQVLAIQVLAPMKKDKILFTASIVGASVSIVVNIAIVSKFQSIGSAVVLLISEISVTTTYILYMLRHKIIAMPFGDIWKNVLLSLPAIAACFLCTRCVDNPFICLAVAVPAAILVWIGCSKLIIHRRFT